jgi:ketosteroid isomerase-like protein
MLTGEAGDTSEPLAKAFADYLELHDADFVIDTSGVNMPGFGVLHGLDGLRDLFARWIEDWEEYRWTHRNWSEVGDYVIVDARVQATGSGSGAEVIWDHCQVYEFRHGKIIRWSLFNDPAQAFTAIGVSE